MAEILNRRPAVGLAVGVVREGHLEFFHGHGVADIPSSTPITEDTVFRVGSITKLFTAIAVMQLWEQELVDLDAPANDYLQAYELTPARAGCRPATLRHLLTHTSGIPEVLHFSDLFHPGWGPFDSCPPVDSVEIGEPLPPLAEYYRDGLPSLVEPGSTFAYSNHGFATLGQIVEDLSGTPLDRYFREHIFEALGMTDSNLVRTERVASRLATGYVLAPEGPKPVPDRDWVGRGAGGVYSTSRDMARFVSALLGGGVNEHGSILQPSTLADMLQSHYRPDPRIPGIGLAFFLGDAGGHRTAGHDGILPGFNSGLLIAPDDRVGVIAFTNGASQAMFWLPDELGRLLRRVLGVPEDVVRGDVPHHPEVWEELCGRYRLPPVSDLRGRVLAGGGVRVFVRGGRLRVGALAPVPALYRGLPLLPDDEDDPHVFRLDLSSLGMSTVRVVFGLDEKAGMKAVHLDLGGQPISLYEHPARSPRSCIVGGLGGLAVAAGAASLRRARRKSHEESQ